MVCGSFGRSSTNNAPRFDRKFGECLSLISIESDQEMFMSATFSIHRLVHALAVLGLVSACLMLELVKPAAAQSDNVGAERINVLFLGDDGHHQPATRVSLILPELAKNGIDIFYTDRLDDLRLENLRRFDVLMAYANHTHISSEQESALLTYVAEGGGFVPIHCASAMFGNSDAYIQLVGGAFKAHGVGVFKTQTIRPEHPAIKGVPDFESWDETYIHMKHNPDKEVLSVRVEEGHEEPWTWVRTHGEGRVFYTAWGHDQRTWNNPGFHQLIERGTRWAAGDWALTADVARPGFEYMEGRLPYYPEGQGWGTTGEPITKLQEPLSPAQSMQQVSIAPGFQVELFASEPDIVNPIDMTWDERGRLWIVETVDYPNEFDPERIGDDRIKILEDTNSDGKADKTTVFADGLNIPTSLTLANGGVIVAQAPDMLFLKDTNGDDQADVKEVLFTGWGTFDTHAGPSNLRYGFDNHIWGAVGYSGFNGAPGGDSVRVAQGFYRFPPDGSGLEDMATTNNNTWGLGFSEEGLVFGSTANGNPIQFAAVPNRYYARLKATYRPNADEERRRRRGNSNIPVLPIIADAASIYPITDDLRQVDWHGKYTSASGFEIYTARSFPQEYWNRISFVSEPTGHLLGKFALQPDGSDYKALNEWNMVASRDAWFSPIQAKVGPDGALWFIDWYNLVIQHNPTPPEHETGAGNAYETEHRDRRHSRIYRIVYDNPQQVDPPSNLAAASAEELVNTLRDDNLHWRLTAQRLLVERGEVDVLPHLYELVRDVRLDKLGLNVGALHALWTMHGLGALHGDNEDALDVLTGALHHPGAGVRRAAVMMLPPTAESFEALMKAGLLPDRQAPGDIDYMVPVGAMDAADAQVRLAVLLALAGMPASERAGDAVALLALVPDNTNDRWIRDALAIAGAHHSEGFLRSILKADIPRRGADSTFVANLDHVVGTTAAHYAADLPSGELASFLAEVRTADPVIARVFLDGLGAGWPEGEAPTFSDDELESLRSVHLELSADLKERFQALADRWGRPEMLSN